jgi:uncharacterized protein with PIN domain
MGSRSKTGNKTNKLKNRMAQQASMILNIPDNCKICNEPFDKKNKIMVMSWFVEVYNEQKRVDLYCPKCNEDRNKHETSRNSGV